MTSSQERHKPFPTGLLLSVAFIVFTLVFGWSAISTLLAPKSYVGEARIQIQPKSGGGSAGGDNNFAQTEAEVISSEQILQPVIAGLHLNVVWGKKYFNDETLKSWETAAILKQRIKVVVVPNTTLIGICVYDDNPNDPAVLANAIANSYLNYVGTNSGNVNAQIIDKAYPGPAPVRPNVSANLFCGIMLGILIGGVCGTAIAVFVYLRSNDDARTEDSETVHNLP